MKWVNTSWTDSKIGHDRQTLVHDAGHPMRHKILKFRGWPFLKYIVNPRRRAGPGLKPGEHHYLPIHLRLLE